MESHREMLKIKRIIIHEDFNINNLENDIALIEVTDMKDQPLDLEKSDYLKKLCLPDGEQPDVGTKCFLAGWGYTEDGLPSDTLKHVDLDINDMDQCINTYKPGFKVRVGPNFLIFRDSELKTYQRQLIWYRHFTQHKIFAQENRVKMLVWETREGH